MRVVLGWLAIVAVEIWSASRSCDQPAGSTTGYQESVIPRAPSCRWNAAPRPCNVR